MIILVVSPNKTLIAAEAVLFVTRADQPCDLGHEFALEMHCCGSTAGYPHVLYLGTEMNVRSVLDAINDHLVAQAGYQNITIHIAGILNAKGLA